MNDQENTEKNENDQDRQIAFVRELGNNIVEEIVKAIKAGKVPANWDGIELRWLLADRCEESAVMRPRKGPRWREYANITLTKF